MKSWRRTFDNPSCQSPQQTVLFFPSAISLPASPFLYLSGEWAEWGHPHSEGCSLLTLSCCSWGTTCWNSGEGSHIWGWETGVLSLHMAQGGAAARVRSALIFKYWELPRNCQQTLESNLEWEPSVTSMLESKDQPWSHRINYFLDDSISG